jgi:hypothetical protein
MSSEYPTPMSIFGRLSRWTIKVDKVTIGTLLLMGVSPKEECQLNSRIVLKK